ncbi:thiol protease/hemagglutinin PrtT [Bacteroides sp. OttesenSCG-928-E20]|nr:thiol protease/hemagglutinin PrtT [Bacteroides sp. OttesenSCG-928-E20]MDL2303725.1 thiol protease/hemagglutinin PrtT [Bacteroides sp. OttesenSCG-928-D19]
MKRTILFSLTLVATLLLWATPVNEGRAKQVALAFLNKNLSPQTRTAFDVKLLWTDKGADTRANSVEGDASFYVFGVPNEQGFVVVAGDDCVKPILGYSIDEPFMIGETELPENISEWFNSYKKQIEWLREAGVSANKDVQKAWTDYSKGTTPMMSGTNDILLETAKWDQMAPYNLKCPVISGSQAPAGCVATALGILINYYRYPTRGSGSHTYKSRTHGLELTAAFNKMIDWPNVLDHYVKGQYTADQGTAVSEILYNCGVMSEMDYGKSSSGAVTLIGARGLVDYMKYDKGLTYWSRDWCTDDELWEEMIKNDIENGRPVLYGGRSEDVGHAFILDGYDSAGYYHVNWGWSGTSNGYFLLSVLDPNEQGTGGGSGAFKYDHEAFLGIQKPQEGSTYQDVVAFFSGKTTEGKLYNGITTETTTFEVDKNFTVDIGYIGNYSVHDFSGICALALFDKDDEFKEFVSGSIRISSMGTLFGGYITLDNCVISTSIGEGDYIKLLYQSEGSEEWNYVKYGGDISGVIQVKGELTDIPLSYDQIKISITQTTTDLIINAPGAIKRIKIFNTSGQTLKVIPVLEGQSQCTIPSSNLPKGVYVVQVTTDKGESSEKILRE